MDLILLKVVFIGAILVTGWVGGLLPLRMGHSPHSGLRLAQGNAFAGGVFLGAGLIHMLPDAFADYSTLFPHVDYPAPALLASLAVLLILTVDQAGRAGASSSRKPSGLLLLVLSLHSVIAGVSLGLEPDLATSLAIFIAIIGHKGAAGFALGTTLAADGTPPSRHRQRIAAFSLATPVGIGLGAWASHAASGRAASLLEVGFDALAAGTFLYIALMDICREAFRDPAGRWGKVAMAWAGLALMALVAIWT